PSGCPAEGSPTFSASVFGPALRRVSLRLWPLLVLVLAMVFLFLWWPFLRLRLLAAASTGLVRFAHGPLVRRAELVGLAPPARAELGALLGGQGREPSRRICHRLSPRSSQSASARAPEMRAIAPVKAAMPRTERPSVVLAGATRTGRPGPGL